MRSSILKAAVSAARPGMFRKIAPKTLYVSRPLVNAEAFISWAKGAGFTSTLAAGDLHVTIAFSRTPVNWLSIGDDWRSRPARLYPEDESPRLTSNADTMRPWNREDPPGSIRVRGGKRELAPLGDKGAVVLKFDSVHLTSRWVRMREAGCSWEHAGYIPHVTITYAKPADLNIKSVEPFADDLVFGEEVFAELDEDWNTKIKEA